MIDAAPCLGDPQLRDYRVVGGLEVFADRSFWPNFFSRTVARLRWDPAAIDLSGDIRAWRGLRAERRRRLTTLLAGFCVAEDAVAEELTPFSGAARKATLASQENLVAWVFFLQRHDEQRQSCSTPGKPRCSRIWPMARCRGCARGSSASSATSAGTSASGCVAWSRVSPRPSCLTTSSYGPRGRRGVGRRRPRRHTRGERAEGRTPAPRRGVPQDARGGVGAWIPIS
jgi:hypothetical protein